MSVFNYHSARAEGSDLNDKQPMQQRHNINTSTNNNNANNTTKVANRSSPRSFNLAVQIPEGPNNNSGFLPKASDLCHFPPDIIPSWSGMDQVAQNTAPHENYELYSVLAESIFGQVVAAKDLRTGQLVAIKLSNMQKLTQLYEQQVFDAASDVLENPVHEAMLMKLLSAERHPYVLNLIEEFTSENGNLHWLVLEFAPHKDLFELVVKAQHFKEDAARHYFLQILDGVNFIHNHGICHLDLSLENLLIDSKWNAKICDFGVARLLPQDGSSFPPMRIRSKLRYMAPEILLRTRFDGRKADIFSLGVILYCMLVGHPPFESASNTDLVYNMIATNRIREVLGLLRLSDRVSDVAADLISHMICPEDRRYNMQQILNHPFLQLQQVMSE